MDEALICTLNLFIGKLGKKRAKPTHYLPLQRLIGRRAARPLPAPRPAAHLLQRQPLKLRPLPLDLVLRVLPLARSCTPATAALLGQQRLPLAAGALLLLGLAARISGNRGGGDRGELHVVEAAVGVRGGVSRFRPGVGGGMASGGSVRSEAGVRVLLVAAAVGEPEGVRGEQ